MTGNDNSTRALQGRAPWPRPDELGPEARELYDELTAGPRGKGSLEDDGRLSGPFNAMLLTPRVGNALQRVGAAIRFECGLEPRTRELATLECARAFRSGYEWNAHTRLASAAGVTEAEIAAILAGAPIEHLSAREASVRELTIELLEHEDLDDERFAWAVDALGYPTMMEVIVLVGYYRLLAMSMRIWRVPVKGAPASFTS